MNKINKDLEQRFKEISSLLKEYLIFTSQWDADAIIGKKLKHPWLELVTNLSKDELLRFDAKREFKIIKDPAWLEAIEKINLLTTFPSLEAPPIELDIVGKKKKHHEFSKIYSLLELDRGKTVADFGGGVGNLGYFLEDNLAMNVNILEKNPALITKGREKFKKLNSTIKFHECEIDNDSVYELKNIDLATGLHTCGNFATDMFRTCINNGIKKIVNFGCCYSKIIRDEYNLSSLSDKSIFLNQRALSSATLGFEQVPSEFYNYRIQILKYKFSFYHWLYKKYGIMKFCSMGNTRRSLYNKSFHDFVHISLSKYFPEIPLPNEHELNSFLESDENKSLNHYFAAYYAISRYFGKLTEAYILCDRALFLQENGYNVEIQSVFDPKISPRNKVIIASKH